MLKAVTVVLEVLRDVPDRFTVGQRVRNYIINRMIWKVQP
jgi:hypothetical protein